jgi:hypothetical protein
VDRLRFIRGCQRLGLRLRDIADLLAIRDTGACPCEPAERHLRRRMAELDAEMVRLATLRAEMAAMVDALPSSDCPPPAPGTWCPRHEKEVTVVNELAPSCCCDDPDCPPEGCGCDC